MADRLKGILQKILDWWNKFTSRQKTVIVSITAAVIFAFAIIIYVFSRPNYEELVTCEDSAEASRSFRFWSPRESITGFPTRGW